MTTAYGSFAARRTRTRNPTVRQIGIADLMDAIAKGLRDFNEMPTHLFYLALIYPVVTFAVVTFYGQLDLLPLIFPLLAGYTLVGPIVAVGTYELSRRREFGRFTSRTNAFLVFKSRSIVPIMGLSAVLAFIYLVWLTAAGAIYIQYFAGIGPESYIGFVAQVLTTPQGWGMFVTGSAVGLIMAVIVLSLSVVSFPMVLDLDVDVFTALKTSVSAVAANPVVMAVWGVIVAVSLIVGSLPLLTGLCVVLPVLGHATWHLYRKIVES